MNRSRTLRFLTAVAAVLVVWFAVLVLESAYVHVVCAPSFAGSWEPSLLRKVVTSLAYGLLLPFAAIAVGLGHLALSVPRSKRARFALACLCGLTMGVVAFYVSTGRLLAAVAVRSTFVALVAGIPFGATYAFGPSVVRFATRHKGFAAALAFAIALVAWWCDGHVLVRAYPAFHELLAAVALGASALVAWPVLESSREGKGEGERGLSDWLTITPVIASLFALFAFVPLARSVRAQDNLRLLVVDHGPILGRALLAAAVVAPPPPTDLMDVGGPPNGAVPSLDMAGAKRSLDWTNHDIVFISVDALRADHVSAYGYERKTTPNIDALAATGTVFENAYCATPNTSYSVTSMMIGKYARPLVLLDLLDDSETWASYVRKYGYRTAAFYPPAVFFIDTAKFEGFKRRKFDFEYAKVEYLPADGRVEQVDAYLREPSVASKPLFLWVHLFEPHEPYEYHSEFPFQDTTAGGVPTGVDRYDSEVAMADRGIGRIVALVQAKRPGAVVIITADHGEEMGEHGGHGHGSTVFEEQVRVPLIIVGPGVKAGHVTPVVQTIDLMATTLSALGVPRPPRLRGRDLGPVLVRQDAATRDPGVALAESDDYTLVARGRLRSICRRKAQACALYDTNDGVQVHDRSLERPAEAKELRALGASLAKEHGRYERGTTTELPDALRRGMLHDADPDVADDVAALLGDAKVDIRRMAAEVCFELHAASTTPSLKRAATKDEDTLVRAWSSVALLRLGEPAPLAPATLLGPPFDIRVQRAAALALAERGDQAGAAVLLDWWNSEYPDLFANDFNRSKEILNGLARLKVRAAVPTILKALEDVRLRAFAADALGAIGDPSARPALLRAFTSERYLEARSHEARALVDLANGNAKGGHADMADALTRFAGVPDPMANAVTLARRAGLLTPGRGGLVPEPNARTVHATLRLPPASASGDAGDAAATPRGLRLLVETEPAGAAVRVTQAGAGDATLALALAPLRAGEGYAYGPIEGARSSPSSPSAQPVELPVSIESDGAILGIWLVREADELPPPPPVKWSPDAGDTETSQRR